MEKYKYFDGEKFTEEFFVKVDDQRTGTPSYFAKVMFPEPIKAYVEKLAEVWNVSLLCAVLYSIIEAYRANVGETDEANN